MFVNWKQSYFGSMILILSLFFYPNPLKRKFGPQLIKAVLSCCASGTPWRHPGSSKRRWTTTTLCADRTPATATSQVLPSTPYDSFTFTQTIPATPPSSPPRSPSALLPPVTTATIWTDAAGNSITSFVHLAYRTKLYICVNYHCFTVTIVKYSVKCNTNILFLQFQLYCTPIVHLAFLNPS